MQLVSSSLFLFFVVTTLSNVLLPQGVCAAAAGTTAPKHTTTTTPEELRSLLRKHRRILDDADDPSNPPTTMADGTDNVSGDGVESVSDGVTTGEPCFSAMNKVYVRGPHQQQEHVISMQQLQVGDYVRDGNEDKDEKTNASFSRVISLAHLDPTRETEFMQIYYTTAAARTSSSSSPSSPPLEITKKHMLFVKEKGTQGGTFIPVRAEKVHVGDILIGSSSSSSKSSSSKKEVVVSAIQYITRTGVYAPITTSGTILVNGIQASSYFEFFDGAAPTLLNQHYLAHYYFAPHRMLCAVDFSRYCQHEEHDPQGYSTNFGIPTLLHLLRWCNEFIVPVQVFLTLCAYPWLVACYRVEQLLLVVSSSCSSLLTLLGALILGRKILRRMYSHDEKRKHKVL